MSAPAELCAIHQPNLLPRLSTLAKLFTADAWVVLDDVQFTRRDYQHRARLAAPDDPDQQQWLTVPVHLPVGRSTTIRDARVADVQLAIRRTRGLAQQYYGRSPYWSSVRDVIDQAVDTLATTDAIASAGETATRALLDMIGWRGTAERSSNLTARVERTHRLVDLTVAMQSTAYLCGTGGARYLDASAFDGRSVRLLMFNHPISHDDSVWTHARRITSLWALARYGPDRLSAELKACALGVRAGLAHELSIGVAI